MKIKTKITSHYNEVETLNLIKNSANFIYKKKSDYAIKSSYKTYYSSLLYDILNIKKVDLMGKYLKKSDLFICNEFKNLPVLLQKFILSKDGTPNANKLFIYNVLFKELNFDFNNFDFYFVNNFMDSQREVVFFQNNLVMETNKHYTFNKYVKNEIEIYSDSYSVIYGSKKNGLPLGKNYEISKNCYEFITKAGFLQDNLILEF